MIMRKTLVASFSKKQLQQVLKGERGFIPALPDDAELYDIVDMSKQISPPSIYAYFLVDGEDFEERYHDNHMTSYKGEICPIIYPAAETDETVDKIEKYCKIGVEVKRLFQNRHFMSDGQCKCSLPMKSTYLIDECKNTSCFWKTLWEILK